MTRLYDATGKVAEIEMTGSAGVDFSADFFTVGNLQYDEERERYLVPDVDYCIGQAEDCRDGVGDFYNPDSAADPVELYVMVCDPSSGSWNRVD